MSIYRLMRAEEVEPAETLEVPLQPPDRPLKGQAATLTEDVRAQAITRTTTPTEGIQLQAIADTLTKYMPAEVVAMYTAILPFLVPKDEALNQQDFTLRWIVVAAIAAIGLIYGVGLYAKTQRSNYAPFKPWVAVWKSTTIVVAFAAWVCLIPGSPFNSFGWYTPSIGAIIAILVGGLLGALAVTLDG